MSVHYFPPSKYREIYESIERVLNPDGAYVEGTNCSDTEEEDCQVLSAFERRTAGLDGADFGNGRTTSPCNSSAKRTVCAASRTVLGLRQPRDKLGD